MAQKLSNKLLIFQFSLVAISLVILCFVAFFKPKPVVVPTFFKIALEDETITIEKDGRGITNRPLPAEEDMDATEEPIAAEEQVGENDA